MNETAREGVMERKPSEQLWHPGMLREKKKKENPSSQMFSYNPSVSW